MPLEARPARGRARFLTETVWGARARLIDGDTNFSAENRAIGARPGVSSLRRGYGIARTPQLNQQASLRGLQADSRHSVLKMWTNRRFGLLTLIIWVFLLLCYYFSPGFSDSFSSNYVEGSNEHANGQSPEKLTAFGAFASFFSPTTCITKENEVLKACNVLQDLNRSECLRYNCCYSPSGTSNLECFVPLIDKPTQMFRMFGLGVISMIFLGCLPIYCCALCRRSKWANPLRRKVNRILKGFKKQRNKQKRNTEMLEPVMEDEEALEGDEKEQETQALISH
ncbi:FMR1 neighbor protein [Dasypus novemcinctus]|uniref:FMR1 neighbor protein n=1 Tax=Dasypus novemcinctus TaxID=9361 RepID=UPI00265DACDC|nr:FMR1 neighbor protein [Dasypus novemcinctus]